MSAHEPEILLCIGLEEIVPFDEGRYHWSLVDVEVTIERRSRLGAGVEQTGYVGMARVVPIGAIAPQRVSLLVHELIRQLFVVVSRCVPVEVIRIRPQAFFLHVLVPVGRSVE